MIDKEAQGAVVGVCGTVLETLAKENGIQPDAIRLRIDLEYLKAKPVFSIFEYSTFRAKSSLRDVVIAGGGRGLAMIISMHIKGIIRDIFKATLARCQAIDTKEIVVLMYLDGSVPTLAILFKGEFLESLSVETIVRESIKTQ